MTEGQAVTGGRRDRLSPGDGGSHRTGCHRGTEGQTVTGGRRVPQDRLSLGDRGSHRTGCHRGTEGLTCGDVLDS